VHDPHFQEIWVQNHIGFEANSWRDFHQMGVRFAQSINQIK